MTIQTKFDIGDEVWYWDVGSNPQSMIIDSIDVISGRNATTIFYQSLKGLTKYEHTLYQTKQDLLNALGK